jgi:hypothetical protein
MDGVGPGLSVPLLSTALRCTAAVHCCDARRPRATSVRGAVGSHPHLAASAQRPDIANRRLADARSLV